MEKVVLQEGNLGPSLLSIALDHDIKGALHRVYQQVTKCQSQRPYIFVHIQKRDPSRIFDTAEVGGILTNSLESSSTRATSSIIASRRILCALDRLEEDWCGVSIIGNAEVIASRVRCHDWEKIGESIKVGVADAEGKRYRWCERRVGHE
jgi:hypothetical protein